MVDPGDHSHSANFTRSDEGYSEAKGIVQADKKRNVSSTAWDTRDPRNPERE